MIKKGKLNPNKRFYIGANLLYQHKDRDFHYGHFDNIGGWPGSSENLYSNFTSDHFSLLPDAGIKFGCNKKVYLKFGFRFNSVSYDYGKFSWNYTTIADNFQQTKTFTEKSGRFSKLLLAGENSYFMLVDNIYFKIGYSF